jgi:predicted ATPase/DNA-binding XRE family transcriptional regulator
MAASPTFGDLLRQHRLAAGLTQESLAERAGLSEHGIQKLERGVTRPYRDTVERLLGALGLSVAEQAALRTVAGGAPRAPRVTLAAEGPRHNLPVPVTSFIGREQELWEIAGRLAHSRLLTLTGIGGCGKTRLALEVARAVLEHYPDGAWLVELAPIADPNLVPQLVATAVGVREGPGQTMTSALTIALRERRTLLVIDNCEHLLEACARLVDDLIRSCAHVRVLATSREALGLTGEVAWRVPSLSIPAANQQLTLTELAANPAVQLIVERAAAVRPRFGLTERNASAIVQICRRLDGIPLALELAAARVQALAPDQIAARLDQRFRLLTGGSRAALPRQQTLRATLDWSYDLLSEPERLLLNRLAVFAGGWSLEAAEAVCSDEHIPPDDVLDLLAQLVSKSLVLADEEADSTERYRLLETVRQYARERLLAAGEAEAVHQRHAAYFLGFGDSLEPQRLYPTGTAFPTAEQLRSLEREHDNLRAALRWWIESADVERATRQAGLLFQIWFSRGHVTEGHEWLLEILSLPSAVGSPAIRRRVLPLFARLACRHGQDSVSLEAYEELLEAQRLAGDRFGAAQTLIEIANVQYLRAAYTDAWAALDASREEARELFDTALEGMWCLYGSMLALCEGRYELARTLAARAVTAFESQNTPPGSAALGSAHAQMTLGSVDLEEGRCPEACARFLRALEVAEDYGDQNLFAHLLEGFSGLASALGQHQRAVRLGGAAEALREADGAPLHPAQRRVVERWLTLSRDALGADAATTAWTAGRILPIERALEEARDGAEAKTIRPASWAGT